MASSNETKIIAEPGKQELFIIREFDAPQELLFKAYTDGALYCQWLGPRGYEMILEKFEPFTGGSYKFTHTDSKGNVYPFRGVYHLVVAPELLVGTFEYEGLPEKGHVEMDTTRIEALPGGRSRLTIQAVYQSGSDRDMMIKSNMEMGVKQGHERLDELFEKLLNNQ